MNNKFCQDCGHDAICHGIFGDCDYGSCNCKHFGRVK